MDDQGSAESRFIPKDVKRLARVNELAHDNGESLAMRKDTKSVKNCNAEGGSAFMGTIVFGALLW